MKVFHQYNRSIKIIPLKTRFPFRPDSLFKQRKIQLPELKKRILLNLLHFEEIKHVAMFILKLYHR